MNDNTEAKYTLNERDQAIAQMLGIALGHAKGAQEITEKSLNICTSIFRRWVLDVALVAVTCLALGFGLARLFPNFLVH